MGVDARRGANPSTRDTDALPTCAHSPTFADYLEAGRERYAIATEAGVDDAFSVAADTIMEVMRDETFFHARDVIDALQREVTPDDAG